MKCGGMQFLTIRLPSRPTRGAWIEIGHYAENLLHKESRPTRGAWIEITKSPAFGTKATVAPHAGRVD